MAFSESSFIIKPEKYGYRYLVLAFFLLTFNQAFCQDDSRKEAEQPNDDRILMIAEQPPEYPGGYESMLSFIKKNANFPDSAKLEGTVYVNFVVRKDGSIDEVKVLRGLSDDCNAEAMRVVKSMPKWKPAKDKGKPVNVRFNLPIRFKR
jgi:periplasmic protein TonB